MSYVSEEFIKDFVTKIVSYETMFLKIYLGLQDILSLIRGLYRQKVWVTIRVLDDVTDTSDSLVLRNEILTYWLTCEGVQERKE